MDISPSHPSPPTPVVGEMHKEAQQSAGGPTSLGATSEEGSHPQLSSAEADPGISATSDFVPKKQGANETSRADDISRKVKLEDLLDILKDTRSSFFTPDSLTDEPIIVLDESEEDEEVAKDKDTEDTLVLPPLSLKLTQIQELMAQVHLLQSQKEELEQAKTLDSLPCLLHKVTETFNRFSTKVDNASGATSLHVFLAGQTTDSPAEGEKNTKYAGTNFRDEFIDLLGKDVLTQYYTKKLLFDKYYDKMLKRQKNPKITNCEVLTKKGPITLNIYREDGSDEVFSNLKVSDLHSEKWREVLQACSYKNEKGWKIIYDLFESLQTFNFKFLQHQLFESLEDWEVYIFTSVYAAVQKLKKDSWLELQFSHNSNLNVVYFLNRSLNVLFHF
ncbi:hypothetical protein Tco_0643661 [Tanacetum coccineum]